MADKKIARAYSNPAVGKPIGFLTGRHLNSGQQEKNQLEAINGDT